MAHTHRRNHLFSFRYHLIHSDRVAYTSNNHNHILIICTPSTFIPLVPIVPSRSNNLMEALDSERSENDSGMSVFLGGNHPTFALPPPPFRPRSEVVPIPPLFPERCRTISERGTRFEWQERKTEWVDVMDRSTLARHRSGPLPPTVRVVPTVFLSFRRTRNSFRSVSFWNKNDLVTRVILIFGSFHHKIIAMSGATKRHRNDIRMTLEWWVLNILERLRNDARMIMLVGQILAQSLESVGHHQLGQDLTVRLPLFCFLLYCSELYPIWMTLKWQQNDVRMMKIVFWNDTEMMSEWWCWLCQKMIVFEERFFWHKGYIIT